jgi:hypothetical protein
MVASVDGMRPAKIVAIITALRRDTLLQKGIRLILDSSIDILPGDHTHGFRPQRGCEKAMERRTPIVCRSA